SPPGCRRSSSTATAWGAGALRSCRREGDQVHDGEDDDPDDVDEVPVQADHLHVETALLAETSPAMGDAPEREQQEHADGDMDAVEAGEDVEGRRRRVAGQLHPVVHDELCELEDLAAEEHRTEGCGGEEPGAGAVLVAPGEGVVGE